MAFYKCLRCGFRKFKQITECDVCGNHVASVTGSTVRLAQKFYDMGCDVRCTWERAEVNSDCNIAAFYFEMEFYKKYKAECFPELPVGFEYAEDESMCKLSYYEDFENRGEFITNLYVKGVIRELYNWAKDLLKVRSI